MDILKASKIFFNNDISEFKLNDVKKLQKIIKYHSDLYYNKENPIISDFEYDNILNKLSVLEKKFLIINKVSNDIGSKILESTFEKVKHSRPMISLGNTYNEDDLNDFNTRVIKNSLLNIELDLEEIKYTLEFKFDGLGLELIYKEGNLIQAITRGNGVEGEDVTINAMQIDNIPKKIKYKNHLEVRGEVVMPISVFNEINEKAKKDGTKIFSNPRNSASGSLRMKDSTMTKKRKLKFFAYDLANFEEFRINENILEYYDVIKRIEKLGFDISSYFLKQDGITDIIKSINEFGNIKKTIDFEIDGLVLKVNNIGLWKTIGFTEHHPRYAIAYKFPAEILTTKILSVEHSVGRTGTITPVANLEPINIGGVIVKRATLHNYEEVEGLDAKIGDTIFIKRAGEVIPKIISVVKEGNRGEFEKILPPLLCPSCETEVLKDENKVRYYCPNNIDCPAKNHEKLAFAVGKQGFNIDGLGIKQIETFLSEGIIHNIVDIFKLSEKRDEILNLEGFQEKAVQNIVNGVEKAKKIDIFVLLTALGIAGIGKKTAKTLSILFESEDNLLNFTIELEDLEELEDIGPEIAKNLINYFNNEAHIRILTELVELLDITYYKNKILNKDSILFGKKVCITGSFEGYSRDELAEKLELVGGVFVTTVSKKTNYLLAGEKAGSKLKKANNLDVEVLDLEGFLNLL